MNFIDLGDLVEVDGKTYKVVLPCSVCDFGKAAEDGKYYCEDFACRDYERRDGENVMFKRVADETERNTDR